uniref:peptidase n=1 Tax=Trichocoleus desertorum TaxID=1481672 RepID=UPI0025B4C2E1|nr:peptidase [Trichocoleus desertorum]
MHWLQRRSLLRLGRIRSPFSCTQNGQRSGDRQLKQLLRSSGLVLGTIALVVMTALWVNAALSSSPSSSELPPLQVHPLPQTLASWRDRSSQGDYFDQIQPLSVGALVWSQFPVKVYVESPIATAAMLGVAKRESQAQVQTQAWVQAVKQAVVEWQAYLPLQLIERSEQADITIWRSPPPLTKGGPKPGDRNYRVRSAETRYELYTKQSDNTLPVLLHRCTIWLRPSQTPQYIQAAARHELGHALGLWGHSPLQTDALYFSQVRNPAAISPRDVNTLKRVYQQPTRLGWPLPAAAIPSEN